MILDTPGLVDAIKDVLATSESPRTREAAKGALWTLGEAGVDRGRWARTDRDEREPAHQGVRRGGLRSIVCAHGQICVNLMGRVGSQGGLRQSWQDPPLAHALGRICDVDPGGGGRPNISACVCTQPVRDEGYVCGGF